MGKRERLIKVEAASGEPFDHGRFEIIVEDLDNTGDQHGGAERV
jgi:hypothetical protein